MAFDLTLDAKPDWSQELRYNSYAGCKLSSRVHLDCYNLPLPEFVTLFDHGKRILLTVATELEDNPGASVTNSIEQLAGMIVKTWPTFDKYIFIESYAWPGKDRTFDLVIFKKVHKGRFANPVWRRFSAKDLIGLSQQIAMLREGEAQEQEDTPEEKENKNDEK